MNFHKKTLLLTGLILAAASIAQADEGRYAGCSTTLVSMAEKNLATTNAAFNLGTANSSDVLYSSDFLLDVQVCAGTIAFADYCAKKTSNLKKLVDIRDKLVQLGVIWTADREQAKKDLAAFTQSCAQ